MKKRTRWQSYYSSGRLAFELWEHPEQAFGWSQDDLEHYALEGHWELLFNALALSGSRRWQGDAATV